VVDPFTHPDLARQRRDLVLREMVATGRLRASDAAIAAAQPLGLRRGPPPPQRFASYGGWVRAVLAGRLPKNAATSWGLSIFTTMDLAWQQQAEAGLAEGLARVESGIGRRGLQGAFVLLDAQTGIVRVMVGGRDPDPGEFNRAFQARRQTGSAIKPIVYATALASGIASHFTPASTVPDLQRQFGTGRDAWEPENAGGSYHESVTLAEALALSLNVATANLVETIGPYAVADAAEKYGLGKMKAVPSIGLGTNEVTPLALTSAFGVFAARGMRRDPTPLRAVVDALGHPVEAAPPTGEQVISEGLAALMTGLLEDVVRYGVARPLTAWYGFDRPVAGKTGTTNDYLDAWFVGFTPLVTAGVWVGYDRPASLGQPATHAAIPVWADIMNRLLSGFPATPFPSDAQLEWANIEPWTGLLADSTCEAMRVPFLPGTSPTMPCSGASLYGLESADSLALEDSVRFAEPEGGSPDTLPMRPEGPAIRDTVWSDSIGIER
jgi:penicillin-binding protein 1A